MAAASQVSRKIALHVSNSGVIPKLFSSPDEFPHSEKSAAGCGRAFTSLLNTESSKDIHESLLIHWIEDDLKEFYMNYTIFRTKYCEF
ncbi:Hypothetical predicted protein [Octopus vulgaris]|uniref:Uncharacterized protein n=1 Tax=Octopus vulgaris TaxID=6645 RepID=A0AA36BWN9_OCTVU|nr:Hypothetical predicted protein [Octopus vulgaris]